MKKAVLPFLMLACAFLAQSQTWQTLANIPVDLTYPVVVQLNGYIHAMGGGATGGATDIHLRYNPTTNKWDTMAPVPYKAQQPAGAVVKGKIHFFGGGYPNSGTRLSKHYSYNPDSNKWTAKATLPIARAIHTGASLDGKLLSLAGQPDKLLFEAYDPDSDKWFTKSPLPDQNFWYGAIVNAQNQLYRFGGGAYFAPANAAHTYNKNTDSWTALPNLPEGLHGVAGAAIGDSAIYITGGYGNSTESAKVWIYHTQKQQYYAGVPLPVGRDYHNMVSIGGCVYVLGGNNGTDASVGTSLIRYCQPSWSLSTPKMELAAEKLVKITQQNDKISIRFLSTQAPKQMQVSVFDMAGRQVLSKILTQENADSFDFYTEGLAQACYLVHVVVDGRVYSQKVVVY